MIKPVQSWPPVAGYYSATLTKGGPRVPVRIWFGAPIVDGEELDRSPRWCIAVNGRTDRKGKAERPRELIDVERYWPHVARHPISREDYGFAIVHGDWARRHPNHPKARPHEPVDFVAMKLPF